MTTPNSNYTTSTRNPTVPPGSRANDPAVYTPQQEREMGIVDDKGHKVQPSGAFVLIALTYVFVAAVAIAVVAIIMHYSSGTGSAVGGQ